MSNIMLMISIIIPTCNQENNLQEALISLNQLNYPSELYEVIIINDHSIDNTKNMLQYLKHKLKYNLRYTELREKTGISAARNLGIKLAKGELLVFTDDDCLFEANWLKHYAEAYRETDSGAFGGPDRSPDKGNLFTRCVGFLFTSFIGTGGLRGGHRANLGKFFPKGCNMAFPAKIFTKLGYFDEYLQPAEEIEFGNRIAKAGLSIKYLPSAFVWHKRKSTLKSYLKKIFKIGYIRIVLASQKKEVFQIGHYIPFLGLMILLLLLSLSFFNIIYDELVLFFILLYLLPVIFSSLTASFRKSDPKFFFLLFFLIPLHHFTHALGVLMGFIDLLIAPKKLYPYFNPEFNNEK